MLALSLAFAFSPALTPMAQSGMNCSGCNLSHSAPAGNSQTFTLNYCPVEVTFTVTSSSSGTCLVNTCTTPVKCEY